MKLPRRARVLAALQARSSGTSIVGTPPEAVPQLRRALTPGGGPARLITGRVPAGVVVDEVTVPLPGRTLLARRYRSPGSRGTRPPVIVDFHGGGFVIGSASLRDWFNGELARRLDGVVVSVEYRLAPEHPFPAAHDDAVAATCWVAENAGDWGADPTRLAVVGDSAGANLAAAVALASAAGAAPPLRAQVLLYAAVDLVGDYPSATEHRRAPNLTVTEMEVYLQHYLGDTDRADPRVSPLFAADHRGVAPAVVVSAEYDPVRDQGPAYARALRAAGVPAWDTVYPGTAHGFLSTPGLYPAALHALVEVTGALRRLLTLDERVPG